MEAALRRECGPMVGRRGEGGDLTTASAKKREVLTKMLCDKYVAGDDLEQSRAFLPCVWASRVQTLEYIVGRVKGALAMMTVPRERKEADLCHVLSLGCIGRHKATGQTS